MLRLKRDPPSRYHQGRLPQLLALVRTYSGSGPRALRYSLFSLQFHHIHAHYVSPHQTNTNYFYARLFGRSEGDFSARQRMSSITKVPDRYMIHVTLYFAPENIPTALKACRALFDEAWKEPQLDFCQIVQNVDEPGILRIQEAWNASRKYLEEVRNLNCMRIHESPACSFSKEDRNHTNGLTLPQDQLHKPYYVPYLEATEHLWLKPRTYLYFLPKLYTEQVDNETIALAYRIYQVKYKFSNASLASHL